MKQLPSRWWHGVSALVFLSGAVAAPIVMVILALGQFSSGTEFFTPGTHVLTLEKPGKYIVWNVLSAFRDGKQYGFSDSLPAGTHIRVVSQSAGREFLTEATIGGSETSGTTKRSSVCSFTIPTAGSYSVIVDGTSEQRLLMVRHSMTANLVRFFVIAGVGSVLGWILAPVLSIIVEVRRHGAKQQAS
ncbi:MAG: hypothetical protein WCL16_10875 [bacterium]